MLASKIWEDSTVLNEDFAMEMPYYSLYSLMKLESAFLGICKYDMFVKDDLYAKYFFAIQRQSVFSPAHAFKAKMEKAGKGQ